MKEESTYKRKDIESYKRKKQCLFVVLEGLLPTNSLFITCTRMYKYGKSLRYYQRYPYLYKKLKIRPKSPIYTSKQCARITHYDDKLHVAKIVGPWLCYGLSVKKPGVEGRKEGSRSSGGTDNKGRNIGADKSQTEG